MAISSRTDRIEAEIIALRLVLQRLVFALHKSIDENHKTPLVPADALQRIAREAKAELGRRYGNLSANGRRAVRVLITQTLALPEDPDDLL